MEKQKEDGERGLFISLLHSVLCQYKAPFIRAALSDYRALWLPHKGGYVIKGSRVIRTELSSAPGVFVQKKTGAFRSIVRSSVRPFPPSAGSAVPSHNPLGRFSQRRLGHRTLKPGRVAAGLWGTPRPSLTPALPPLPLTSKTFLPQEYTRFSTHWQCFCLI